MRTLALQPATTPAGSTPIPVGRSLHHLPAPIFTISTKTAIRSRSNTIPLPAGRSPQAHSLSRLHRLHLKIRQPLAPKRKRSSTPKPKQRLTHSLRLGLHGLQRHPAPAPAPVLGPAATFTPPANRPPGQFINPSTGQPWPDAPRYGKYAPQPAAAPAPAAQPRTGAPAAPAPRLAPAPSVGTTACQRYPNLC